MARPKVTPVKFKESKRFKPHFNEALGKYYHTKDDYLGDMKRGGYEPYTGEAKAPERARPDTAPTNAVLRAIRDCSNRDGSFTPGTVLKQELMRRGVIMTKDAVQRHYDKVKEMQRG
jgi:hypothetical protein